MSPRRALDAFRRSLADITPPADASAPLRGVWHALRGEWAAAHDAVQDDTAECAWVHAALHREEGDPANAGYWYRRASRTPAQGEFRDEYLAIAAALLDD
ncbi:MAG: hypothetical protein U1F36_00280 [Planctomycetota bacterium]